jgi:hypothetical protein
VVGGVQRAGSGRGGKGSSDAPCCTSERTKRRIGLGDHLLYGSFNSCSRQHHHAELNLEFTLIQPLASRLCDCRLQAVGRDGFERFVGNAVGGWVFLVNVFERRGASRAAGLGTTELGPEIRIECLSISLVTEFLPYLAKRTLLLDLKLDRRNQGALIQRGAAYGRKVTAMLRTRGGDVASIRKCRHETRLLSHYPGFHRCLSALV